jgi:hypothetical protein
MLRQARPQALSCARAISIFRSPNMTARSIRRALERKQKKITRKAGQQNSLAMPAAPALESGVCFDSAPISAARLAANRANARQSTGPRTAQGKAVASRNAVKTGLTGHTVLLPTEDAPEYERHLAAFRDEYQPIGLLECELVQSIADTFWRLARIPSLETAIFAKGRIEFANLFDEQELAARPHLIDAHTFLVYEKQIRNLQLQEARLVRRREKETAELRKLQAERAQKEGLREPPPANGFEFSTDEFQNLPLPARIASAAQPPVPSVTTGQTVTHQAA